MSSLPTGRRARPGLSGAPCLAGLIVGACLLAACHAPAPQPDTPEPGTWRLPPLGSMPPARDMDYTETFAVRFGDERVGYVVEVLEVPGGVTDERGVPPGTWLVQDEDFGLIGFLSPHATAYRFVEDGARSVALPRGTRDEQLAALFGRTGVPILESTTPALGTAEG